MLLRIIMQVRQSPEGIDPYKCKDVFNRHAGFPVRYRPERAQLVRELRIDFIFVGQGAINGPDMRHLPPFKLSQDRDMIE